MENINFLPKKTDVLNKFKIHMKDANFIESSSNFLLEEILKLDNNLERPLVTICIGTDRSTGDSLGPLVGWHLKKIQPYNSLIYGNLQKPVHATNLKEHIDLIENTFKKPIIIAVDACLGNLDSVGFVSFAPGPLKPGAAINKNLPALGDLSISGIVNVGGFMEYFVLQNTRLKLVMTMAEKIAHAIAHLYQRKCN